MRYTECRMSKLSSEMLADIEKETVDWQPNYDDKEEEPPKQTVCSRQNLFT
jgi:DNA gyrase subunit A